MSIYQDPTRKAIREHLLKIKPNIVKQFDKLRYLHEVGKFLDEHLPFGNEISWKNITIACIPVLLRQRHPK